MPIVFDGKAFALKIEKKLLGKIDRPYKIVTFLDEENVGSVMYTKMKEKVAGRLGIGFEAISSKLKSQKSELKLKINELNKDKNVDGIMIQVPFEGWQELAMEIDPKKDVDGLREDSPYMPAVVRGIAKILNTKFEIPNNVKNSNTKIIVVGNRGIVGRGLMKQFPNAIGMDKEDFSPSTLLGADVIISATGQPGLITGDIVKEGFVAIDAGYPSPEFTQEALDKSRFNTPVPGGVGPVTVISLFENLVEGV